MPADYPDLFDGLYWKRTEDGRLRSAHLEECAEEIARLRAALVRINQADTFDGGVCLAADTRQVARETLEHGR